MNALRYSLLTVMRHRWRAGLTILSVALAVLLFTLVSSLKRGLDRMLATSSRPDVLIVFDKFQSCPPLSKLPAAHLAELEKMPGVVAVMGELFVVSSCSRATDLVAVHGVEPSKVRQFRDIRIPDEDFAVFAAERGSAIVGAKAAARYGWTPGQTVSLERLGGLTFTVRGIFTAPGDSLESAILTDIDYLRLASDRPGETTLYHVRAADAAQTDAIGARIDRTFSSSAAPTRTALERSFVLSAVSGLSGLIEFSAILGYGALGLIVLGVGNSLSMGIRDRTREVAILKVTGFRRPQVLRVMIAESVLFGAIGGILGVSLAALIVQLSHFSLSVEGFTFSPHLSGTLITEALVLSVALGCLAAYLPARRVAQLPVAAALRNVD
jgi:putative ABC transport system permease protein